MESLCVLTCVLSSQGKYKAAEEMNRQILQIQERTLGSEYTWKIWTINNLALVLLHQGKYEAAKGLSRQAVRGFKKSLGINDLLTLSAFNNLVSVL